MSKIRNVLFLCTANSARSILAEALLRDLGEGRYPAFSAGSKPRGEVNPDALSCLERHGHSTGGLSSKSWEAFTGADALIMDLIVTVCDKAAGEACPIWPGHPLTVHWGVADPAGADGAEGGEEAFDLAYARLERRIRAFLAIVEDMADLDLANVKARLQAIGDLED